MRKDNTAKQLLARLMGHADIQMLRRYLDMSESDAAAEYASRGAGENDIVK